MLLTTLGVRSRKLRIGQEGISRIEKRTDLYISTLRSYVAGVGGKLWWWSCLISLR
jgi:hypothetical protein